MPDGADGMNDISRRQPISPGDLGEAGFAAMKGAAFGQKPRAGRAMDRPIHAAAAEQRGICGVDDRIDT
jgi:hypothetical protein